MAELSELTTELIALLRQMDDPETRGTQPKEDSEGGHSKPGSKPPVSLDPVSWARQIREEAIALDTKIRESRWPQPWDKAIRALGATPDDQYPEVHSQVSRWVSTCRTVLGQQAPAKHMKYVACLNCGKTDIWYRADDKDPHAQCRNKDCYDEDTGRSARYRGDRLMLLTRNRVAV